MKKNLLWIGTICTGLGLGFTGCSSAPGTAGQQGAVVGGVTGAGVGASVTKNRALGAVIGGAVGAAGGYVVGNKTGHLDKKDKDVHSTLPDNTTTSIGPTADLNNDGFVTLDEIASLEKSGESDDVILQRVQATGKTFDLNDEQRKYLSDHGALKDFMREQEATYLNRALAQTSGDKEKAAELLGISLATLYRKLAEVEEATV